MSRTGFFFRFLAALLLVGLLIAGGFFIFQSGQAQGYALGVAASSGSSTAPDQAVPYYPMVPHAWTPYYGPHFFFFGPLFFCGAIFFFFFLMGGLFRFGHHHRHYGEEHTHWMKHTHADAGSEQGNDRPPAPTKPAE